MWPIRKLMLQCSMNRPGGERPASELVLTNQGLAPAGAAQRKTAPFHPSREAEPTLRPRRWKATGPIGPLEDLSMTRLSRVLPMTVLALALAGGLSACGHNMEQRAATGAIAGAVVAGPAGAVVGAGVGAVVNEADKPK
jgi:osmotically inducible lipoprotein OsmB